MTDETLKEYRFFGIFVYRTMSKEHGPKIAKLIGPIRPTWYDVLISIFTMFPPEQVDSWIDCAHQGSPPLSISIMTDEIILPDPRQVEHYKLNLLRDKHEIPITTGDNKYQIAMARVFSYQIDAPKENETITETLIGLIKGSRDYELLEILRVHESSAEDVREYVLNRKVWTPDS